MTTATIEPVSEGERRQAYAAAQWVSVDEVGPCGRCKKNLTIRYGEFARVLCGTCRIEDS